MFPLTLNALVHDPQIFVCSITWITKHGVVCIQLAAGLILASGLHNRMRISSMAIGGVNCLAWARSTVVPAIGRLQQVNFFSIQAAYGAFVTLTNDNGFNALVFDPQIFVRSRAWIAKHGVVCIQLAAGLIGACGLHNPMRISSMAIGRLNIFVWTRTKVMPAIGRLQHVNYFSILAADGVFEGLTNGNGFWRLSARELDLQVFVCPRTWITKYCGVRIQLTAGLFVASALHNRKGILGMTVGGLDSGMTARTKVMPAKGSFYDLDVSTI